MDIIGYHQHNLYIAGAPEREDKEEGTELI